MPRGSRIVRMRPAPSYEYSVILRLRNGSGSLAFSGMNPMHRELRRDPDADDEGIEMLRSDDKVLASTIRES